jgi:hypothetical protein
VYCTAVTECQPNYSLIIIIIIIIIIVNGEGGDVTGHTIAEFRKEPVQSGKLSRRKHGERFKTTFNERKLSHAETESKGEIFSFQFSCLTKLPVAKINYCQ